MTIDFNHPTPEIVEAVAAGLAKCGLLSVPWDTLIVQHQEMYRKDARAAIAAMAPFVAPDAPGVDRLVASVGMKCIELEVFGTVQGHVVPAVVRAWVRVPHEKERT